MKTVDTDIKTIIANAAKIIAPLWPMQTIIARNPLQCIESLPFEEALALGEFFFNNHSDEKTNTSRDINQEMIKWCQVFLDEGQATITMPEREKGFYHAWALLAPFDKKLRSNKKNKWLFSLPSEPEEAIFSCLKRLCLSEDQIEDYIKYSLAQLPGWAGYIKWRAEWQDKNAGIKNPITLEDFLAVRLIITCALEQDIKENKFKKDLIEIKKSKVDFFRELKLKEEKHLLNLLKMILPESLKLNKQETTTHRPDAQIIFCIDVRSEPFRKRIEAEGQYETFGFAGFFGLPVSIHDYNTSQTKNCCPVLLTPKYRIFEEPIREENKRISHHQKGRHITSTLQRFYQNLKYNFATPFALVETLGLWSGLWMASRTLFPQKSLRLKKILQENIKPKLTTCPRIEIPLENQITHAESVLRLMGLTKNFSPLIVFCGHRSQTENNPYASALDCGACGGNHGGPNGKILATILNSSEIRKALEKKGIMIPSDTLFLGAEHNTTTDEVAIEEHGISKTIHKEIVEKLKAAFIKAGMLNSQYRCKAFGLEDSVTKVKNHVLKRSSDWSEVRPEWGLARNAGFIIGPRSITKEVDLDGRCFLHSYDWTEDVEGNFLETILTAPVVVAEWINTQYFFSTLNNTAYGSGSKITHNITGKFGVMQGNSSDLMHGLPLQSVNKTDDHPYHDPMRLQVVVYAPRSRIESIVKKHPLLQTLTFNQWAILVAIDPEDNKPYRFTEKAEWVEIVIESDECKTPKYPYKTKNCVIATMHDKEKVIAPAFLDILNLQTIKTEIDTDQLGTFSREIERQGTPLECARRKCELAIEKSKVSIAIASEGSFAPHPLIPFTACDHEILYFLDQERDFSIYHSVLSTHTNYRSEAFSDTQQLKTFSEETLFPSHALIVRPNKENKKSLVIKGIGQYDELEEAFLKCCRVSEDGTALVETDMRAHMNPTRMEVIQKLAHSLACRLATPCLACDTPGWGLINAKKGLECMACGSETEMIKFEIFGCTKCDYKEYKTRQDNLTYADPQYCPSCNP